MEKPLADTGVRGRDMVRAAAERGLVLMADHTYCCTPAVLKIRELIEEGALGAHSARMTTEPGVHVGSSVLVGRPPAARAPSGPALVGPGGRQA